MEINFVEDYFWEGGDLIAQIVYELFNYPDSCFAKDVNSWYNLLYSRLSYEPTCEYRLPDPELPDVSEVQQFLIDYGLDVAFDILEGYLIAQFAGSNPSVFNNAINELKQLVQSQI